ncbi:DNA polymerase-3 subunit epsilon [Shimia isoporae]|uniref:DNA-directed DNA polymerase n=1 Tax=Shimia isoporae TaxID=647720 RepID=A0A4V2Q3Z2_9RHOB|nr:exonuclease domain-containing protein [Shimia isoporae]TCL09070.1 DNA polymerase-3 subunit epsilon [Shimia isoporae]
MTRLSLRLRILLFFALMAAGGILVVALALFAGYRHSFEGGAGPGFMLAAIISGFGLLGLATAIWFLFDENVAKPIERLASTLRVRAHAGVPAALDTHAARYLGDLAPAADAVTTQLDAQTLDAAELVALETEALSDEKNRLTALLSEIPLAIVLIGPTHRIVLYDGQAASALAQIAPPRLNASIFDYFDKSVLLAAHDELVKSDREIRFEATCLNGDVSFAARLKPLGTARGYMMLIDEAHTHLSPEASRPLTYDFDLLSNAGPSDLLKLPIDRVPFVVFDSETTGLLPHKDEVVQLGAVRVLRGMIVAGEKIDRLVNPARPIPPASTKVHHITDAMVADAPPFQTVATEFHHFARDAVIVAHNAPFDMAFLHRRAKDYDLAWTHPVLDTVLLSAVLFGTTESHTLDALCSRLGVSIPQHLRHTALGDAQATAEVLCRMLPMLKSRGFDTLQKVIEQCQKHSRLLEDLN